MCTYTYIAKIPINTAIMYPTRKAIINPFSLPLKYPTMNPRHTPITVIASTKLPIDPRPIFGDISDTYCGTE